MARGEETRLKVHHKGQKDDFIVFVDSKKDYEAWLADKQGTPLAQVVSGFHVYTTNKQGAQGLYNEASSQILAQEFDTEDTETAIRRILELGADQITEFPERVGNRNDAQAPYTR